MQSKFFQNPYLFPLVQDEITQGKVRTTIPFANNNLLKDWKNVLFEQKLYAGINLKIGEDIIPAHKCIISARYSYFAQKILIVSIKKFSYNLADDKTILKFLKCPLIYSRVNPFLKK